MAIEPGLRLIQLTALQMTDPLPPALFAPDQGAKRAALWQFQEQVNAHGI